MVTTDHGQKHTHTQNNERMFTFGQTISNILSISVIVDSHHKANYIPAGKKKIICSSFTGYVGNWIGFNGNCNGPCRSLLDICQ